MVVVNNEYVAIPKNKYFRIQEELKKSNLTEDEKIEFGIISFENLREEQKNSFLEAKKLKNSDFVNL